MRKIIKFVFIFGVIAATAFPILPKWSTIGDALSPSAAAVQQTTKVLDRFAITQPALANVDVEAKQSFYMILLPSLDDGGVTIIPKQLPSVVVPKVIEINAPAQQEVLPEQQLKLEVRPDPPAPLAEPPVRLKAIPVPRTVPRSKPARNVTARAKW